MNHDHRHHGGHPDEEGGTTHLLHVHGPTRGPMLWVSLGITVVFVVGELIAGGLAHSLALLSDAGHNASDALALALAAYAIQVSRRPASAQNTFGYHRVSILSAFLSASALMAIAGMILVEAVRGAFNPAPVNASLMMGVAAIAVLMNTVIASLLSRGAKHSLNERAAYIHMVGDALSAAGVLVGGFVIRLTGWAWVDALVSALIAVFIVVSSWGILRQATRVLLEATPQDLDVDQMIAEMQGMAGVVSVHDLHVWTLSDGMNFLSCHVEVPGDFSVADSAELIKQLTVLLSERFGIGHATIQTEPAGTCLDETLHCAGNDRPMR